MARVWAMDNSPSSKLMRELCCSNSAIIIGFEVQLQIFGLNTWPGNKVTLIYIMIAKECQNYCFGAPFLLVETRKLNWLTYQYLRIAILGKAIGFDHKDGIRYEFRHCLDRNLIYRLVNYKLIKVESLLKNDSILWIWRGLIPNQYSPTIFLLLILHEDIWRPGEFWSSNMLSFDIRVVEKE